VDYFRHRRSTVDMRMTLAEKEARWEWFTSQARWHEKRPGKWHLSQGRWYRRQSRSVFTFSDIVARTIRHHAPQVAANIAANNTLLARLIPLHRPQNPRR
jgi:hypothetical protein